MLRRRYKFILGAAGLTLGIFAVYIVTTVGERTHIPDEFIITKQETAKVGQKIVDLTKETNEKIRAVNISDFGGDPDSALSFIKEARDKNGEAYDQAVLLARYLQNLAASLYKIKSIESQRLAYEAVAVELALVGEFIIYTQKLDKFLDNLSRAVITDSTRARKIVADSLNEVNVGVISINKLNEEFNSKMTIFEMSL